MGLFDSILSRIKTDLDAKNSVNQHITDIVHGITKARVSPESIMLKNGVLRITTSSTLKTAILLKKEALMEALRSHNIIVSRII